MKNYKWLLMVLAVVVVGGIFVWAMRYGFDHSTVIRGAFSFSARAGASYISPGTGAAAGSPSIATPSCMMVNPA